MDERCDAGPDAEAQRTALRDAIAFKKYEFDAHGVEMNQRYRSTAVVTDGQMEPAFDDEPHFQPTTYRRVVCRNITVFVDQMGSQGF